MTALPGHRVRQAGAFVALALACAIASADEPATYMGKPVQTLTFTVRGTTVWLHTVDNGFIPESTDRFTFDSAGPQMRRGIDGHAPRYRWDFGFALKGDVKPVHVRVEHFDKDADTLLVDDAAPAIADGRWRGQGVTDCEIARGSACAAWIYEKGLQPFVFRMTVEFDDGTKQELYQGAAFNPDEMTPIWTLFGVKR